MPKTTLISLCTGLLLGISLASVFIVISLSRSSVLSLSKQFPGINAQEPSIKTSVQSKKEEVLPIEDIQYKWGRILLTAPQTTQLTEEEKFWLATGKIGGVFLLQRNIVSFDQVEKLVHDIHLYGNQSGKSPFIAIDQEGGFVSRLPWVESTFQDQITDVAQAQKIGMERCSQLKQLGFTMLLAPVVEPILSPTSYLAKQRRFFVNDEVWPIMMNECLRLGVTPVLKHFPGGLGLVELDPHDKLPVITTNSAAIQRILAPFQRSVALQAPAIMVSHLIFPEIDPFPTSKSSYWLTSLLKQEMDYHGLVMIDDLSMGAVSDNEVGNYAVASILAGADMLLVSDYEDLKEIQLKIEQNLSNPIFQREISRAVSKVEEVLGQEN